MRRMLNESLSRFATVQRIGAKLEIAMLAATYRILDV